LAVGLGFGWGETPKRGGVGETPPPKPSVVHGPPMPPVVLGQGPPPLGFPPPLSWGGGATTRFLSWVLIYSGVFPFYSAIIVFQDI